MNHAECKVFGWAGPEPERSAALKEARQELRRINSAAALDALEMLGGAEGLAQAREMAERRIAELEGLSL